MVDISTPAMERLDSTNYHTWAARMKCQLISKGLWRAVINDDEPTDDSLRARSLMGLSADSEHLVTIMRCETAKEAWATLQDTFKTKGRASKNRLRIALSKMKMAPTETLTKYIARAKTLQDHMRDAGIEIKEEDFVWPVIMGLPSSFDTIITILETSDDEITLNSVLPKLVQVDDRHRCGRPEHQMDSALLAKPSYTSPTWTSPATGQGPPPSYGERRPDSRRPDSRHLGGPRPDSRRPSGPRPDSRRPDAQQRPSYQRPDERRFFGHNYDEHHDRMEGNCLYCHRPGHIARECNKKTRDMEAARRSGRAPRRNNQYSAIAFASVTCPKPSTHLAAPKPAFSAVELPSPIDTCRFVLDTGASRHMTPTRSILTDLRPPPEHLTVTFGNGAQAKPAGVGDVYLELARGTTVVITDVLYMPNAAESLFSVSYAANKGFHFSFGASGCEIFKGSTSIAHVPTKSDIYYLEGRCLPNARAAYAARTNESPELWHRRFGHLGFDNLTKMENLVTGMATTSTEFKAAGTNAPCEACTLGKQHRLPFIASTSATHAPLELLHTDLCGPMPVPSTGGNTYFLTILDDFTNFSFVYPLSSKSDATAVIITAVTMLERQTGHTVKRIRSDNGGEFTNSTLGDFYKSKGILAETTNPYTPQQNGKAERLNRTLWEKARPMLADSTLPKTFWAEAIVTANYLRNRSPASGQALTPFELFHGSKPNVAHLRTFGARAYAHTPSALRTKLDPVSQPGRLLGYATNRKGYKILLDSGTIITSRDVTFDETKPPKPNPDSAPKLPPRGTLPKTAAPKLIFLPDIERVGAAAEPQPELQPEPQPPPSPEAPPLPEAPIATHRPVRAAASRPASVWERDAYRITGRANVAANAAITCEPTTMGEALSGPDAALWTQAMDEEMASLHANDTWTLREPPRGTKPIPAKWVYKIKRDSNGNIERYKARLVVKGFRQREGIDYDEVFAPVSKYSTLRTVLAIAASQDLELHQLDIKTAFLNGTIDEDVYVEPPPGYILGTPNLACKLNKALYGLKQAPRAWHATLKAELAKLGFFESSADAGLFISTDPSKPALLLTYVDDILILSLYPAQTAFIKRQLMAVFDAHDLGAASFFLGMDIIRDRTAKTIKLAQSRHITDLLSKYGMDDAKPAGNPSSTSIKLTKEGEPLDTQTHPYAALVGSLMYLSICTRPDIAQAVGALARYMSKPTTAHWTSAKTVLRYLAGTADLGITFGAGSPGLQAFCDADYAGDIDTRRSTTGYVFLLNGGAISWASRLQPTVAASTTEAEYIAAATTIKEGLWLRKLFQDLGLNLNTIDIRTDSQSALKLLKNPIVSNRSKHIDIVHHFARERVARNEVTFEFIPTDSMVADALTKPVPTTKFIFCRTGMGLS